MRSFETWMGQDVLQLTVEDWSALLDDSAVFNERVMEMVSYVYRQPEKCSTASDIGYALGNVSQQSITALNRSASKKIYENHNKEAPANADGGTRYWNVLFDGNPNCPNDEKGHFIWRLRDNLITAIRLRETTM